MPLAYIKLLNGPDDVDPGYGNDPARHPAPPIVLPPLPPGTKPPVGTWPPRFDPNRPEIAPPIFIEDDPPSSTLPIQPGQIWPPLNPGTGIGGKVLALVWIVGVGYRWVVLQSASIWPPPVTAEPK